MSSKSSFRLNSFNIYHTTGLIRNATPGYRGVPRARYSTSSTSTASGSGTSPVHGVLIINLESQLRLAAEVTGNSLSALLASHSYHVHTHICLCLRTPDLYIMIVNLTFRHCFNVFDGSVFLLIKCHSARGIWVSMKAN